MRRLTIGVVLAMATSAIVAQSASTCEQAVRRTVEVPGTGFAVTLPSAWRIWSPQGPDEHVVTAGDVRTGQSCDFSLVEDAVTAQAAADETVETLKAHRDIEVVERTVVTVPAGDAVRVSYRYTSSPDEPRFVYHVYYLAGPDGVGSVSCMSAEPPADCWLSIVESIEPLPSGGLASAPFDPRVEVPEHGFGVDFPAEWLVRASEGPGPLLGGDPVLRAVTATGGPASADCTIEDDTGLPSLSGVDSLAGWQEVFTAYAIAQEQRASVPVVTEVALPSGRSVQADWPRRNGMPATAWVFLDGDRRVALFCRSEEPPDDRWRSIAETFAFLTEEE
jgi:hypothetical protein